MIYGVMLTQDNGKILGPVAKLLGYVLNFIFNILNKIGIPNVGLAIIIFTIFIYIALLPLTIKQQKFSKLSAIMGPELNAVREKYKGKTDQISMQKQNEEMNLVYKKYGVSPTGSCVQLIIQMPILFALYRVINNIPAYVDVVREPLEKLAEQILNTAGGSDFIAGLTTATKYFSKLDFTLTNSIIDVLNRASTDEWDSIIAQFPNLTYFNEARADFVHYNLFLGLNISDSPSFIIKNAFANGEWLLVIGALMIPVLSAVTQWINFLFMPQSNAAGSDNAMAQSMKSMNLMMPIMSAVFCFSFPCGLGIYWIAGAVIRSIEQVIINKHIDKMDYEKIVEKNKEKYEKQKGKIKENEKRIAEIAASSTRNISKGAGKDLSKIESTYNSNPKPGGIAAKANMVKEYNERNSK